MGDQNGISFQVNASQSKGKANGSEVVHDNTQILASNQVSLTSGRNTELRGAQVSADAVKARVGGDLLIETQQDRASYQSEQNSSGFDLSVCVPPLCYGAMVTGSVNVSESSINHNYQSAVGQSGIAAGAGGFDIEVKGNTGLVGGAITSTAAPEKNRLQTQSLTNQDLDNQQTTEASASSLGLSYGDMSAMANMAVNVANNVLSNSAAQVGQPENVNEHSQTQSVISAGNIVITGTGADKEASEQTAATLTSRDPESANGALHNQLTLVQAQDLGRQRQEAQEAVEVGRLLGSVGAGLVGDFAQDAGWKDGSPQKVLLHGLVGAVATKLGGGNAGIGALSGALNEVATTAMAEFLNDQGIYKDRTGEDKTFDEMMKAGSAILGTAVGQAAGGNATDVAMAGQVAKLGTELNYLKHEQWSELAKKLQNCKTAKPQTNANKFAKSTQS